PRRLDRLRRLLLAFWRRPPLGGRRLLPAAQPERDHGLRRGRSPVRRAGLIAPAAGFTTPGAVPPLGATPLPARPLPGPHLPAGCPESEADPLPGHPDPR